MTSLRRLGIQEAASSAIEYALMLAILIAGTLALLNTAGPAIKAALNRLVLNDLVLVAPGGTEPMTSSPAGPVMLPNPSWHVSLSLAAILVAAIGLVICRILSRRRPSETPPEPVVAAPTPADRLVEKRQRMLRFLSTNTQVVFGNQLAVRHMMTSRLQTVGPKMTVEQLRQLEAEKNIHHLLVVDAEGRLIGVISDRDLLARSGMSAGEIMTINPSTVGPDTPVSAALTVLLQNRISCVPVVDDQRPCGILTATDVILALQCIIQTLERAGAVTHGMLAEEIELEGTLQVLLRLTERNNTPSLANSA